jgi:hypothetical protein
MFFLKLQTYLKKCKKMCEIGQKISIQKFEECTEFSQERFVKYSHWA